MNNSGEDIELGYIGRTRRIVLVGRGGNGKSSCIKSIKSVQLKDSDIIAVECPGVGDTGEDRTENIDSVRDNVERTIAQFEDSGGVNAVVFVMKYGVRFTKQEKDAVEDVKSMFGRDVFSKYGIIIMTYGDLFEMDDEGHAFNEWCRRQSGDIQNLFIEVDHRIVLFNNKTKDTPTQSRQVQSLLDLCGHIKKAYTMSDFNMKMQDRLKLTFKEKGPGASLVDAVRGHQYVFDRSWYRTAEGRKALYIASIPVCVALIVTIIFVIYVCQ